MRTSLRSPLIHSLVRLLSVVSILVTLELCCRAFLPSVQKNVVYTPEAGRLYLPDLNYPQYSDESGLTIKFRTNSFGHRGPEPIVPKPENTRRVVIFGDSFTAAVAYEEADTFCGLLDASLREGSVATSGERWEVWNFGMVGSTTAGQFAKYQTMLDRLDPDVVLVCLTMQTDLLEAIPHPPGDRVLKYQLTPDGDLTPFPVPIDQSTTLKGNSRFYRWQKGWSNDLFRDFKDPVGFHGTELHDGRMLATTPERPEMTLAWEVTAEILKRFRHRTERDGVRFGLVALPASWQVYEDRLDMIREATPGVSLDADLVERRLTSLCGELGIPMYSLTPAFRRACPSASSRVESEWLLFHGRGHLNRKGHRLVADELRVFLSERGWGPVAAE